MGIADPARGKRSGHLYVDLIDPRIVPAARDGPKSLDSLETAIFQAERDTIDQEIVTQAIAEIKSYQQMGRTRLVLPKAIL